MDGVTLFEALIAYTAIITTVVGAVIGWLLRDYAPLKNRVSSVEKTSQRVDSRVSNVERSQDELEEEFRELVYYLRKVVGHIERETDIEDLPDLRNDRSD